MYTVSCKASYQVLNSGWQEYLEPKALETVVTYTLHIKQLCQTDLEKTNSINSVELKFSKYFPPNLSFSPPNSSP